MGTKLSTMVKDVVVSNDGTITWLAVPVEAAGVAQAAGGMATAVAAAAAGVSTVLNYWAGLEDDTAGDLEVLGKGE